MQPPALDLVDLNFRLATCAFIATSKSGEVVDAHDLTLANTGAPLGEFNVAFPKRPTYKLGKSLDRAAAYFDARKLPYRVIVRAEVADGCRELLLPRGFTETKPVPGMRLAPIPEIPPAPEGLEVRRVGDDGRTLADFQTTAFEGFGLPTAAAPLFMTREFAQLPRVGLCVGYADGEPAATAALVGSEQVAGIYWVATREAFRKRGYGEAVTWEAVRMGRELGYAQASLQASEMGRPVYARMGFDHDRDYVQLDSPRG